MNRDIYMFDLQMEQNAIDQIEAEDQKIVLSVQKGIKSKFYNKGRYSATYEKGTHHFHRIISSYL